MNVELVCSSRELFGADRSAIRLATLLETLGADVSLTVPASRPSLGMDQLAERRGLRMAAGGVVIASSRGLTGLRPSPRNAPPANIDLTIYNSSAVLARRGDSAPRALVLREWIDPQSARHRALVRYHGRRVAQVVAVSHGVGERWAACAGAPSVTEICPNWLEPQWLTRSGDESREGVLFAGRLNRWKGHGILADAFGRAFRDVPYSPSLTFLGAEGAGSPFHEAARALRERCAANGWTLADFDPDPRRWFRRAALVVVPSLRPEPFGNVVLEALSCGARVLAFPGGGIDDLAPRFGDPLMVVPRTVADLARGLGDWFASGGGGQSRRELSHTDDVIARHYTAEAAAPRWQAVLDRVAP